MVERIMMWIEVKYALYFLWYYKFSNGQNTKRRTLEIYQLNSTFIGGPL